MKNPICYFLLMVATVAATVPGSGNAEQIEAFTEPYRRVAVPAAEIGVIESLLVREGDVVSERQLLGKLDDAVLQSSLNIAAAAKNADGPRRNAETELTMRQQQFQSYQSLLEEGNATGRELARAEMEMQQSAARLQSVREELELRQLEYERVKHQIKQRQIESPLGGVVVSIEKVAGEFVSPTDPVVLHVVQLDVLKAVFSVPRSAANEMRTGQIIAMTIDHDEQICEGRIEFISPVANPESNSVRVKVRIENDRRQYPSGVTCRWDVNSSQSKPNKSESGKPIASLTH